MNELEWKMAQRKKQRRLQQQKRRTRLLLILFLLGLALLLFYAYPRLTRHATEETNATVDLAKNTVAYPIPPEPTSDLLAAIIKPDGVKTCYLTFDDGPNNSVTPKILDILRRYNVSATFFTVGTLLQSNPDMARRIVDEGHLLANHSYSHNYSHFYADKDTFMNEINATFKIITDITGQANYPKVFRFPGGGFNSGYYGEVKQGYKELLKENHIRFCDWNALCGDAESAVKTEQELIDRTKKTANKEDIVILMHDATSKAVTADALPEIIEYLSGQRYVFKRLDQAPLA